jgi:hypothetical protein
MQWCIHFADDWEEEEGDVWKNYSTEVKVELPLKMAHHCHKFEIVEYAFNVRWKLWMALSMHESHTPNWYHEPIMQGPKPKPICTGVMW